MKYIIDSRYFDGVCITSMHDDKCSDYGGETLEELREREKNPYLIAVSPKRMSLLVKRYTQALCKPFQEITEERYDDLLNCLPPARMKNGWFFVGEPYYGNLYPFCFRSDDRFFMAERSLRLTDPEISCQIRAHMKIVDLHPVLVKEDYFIKYVSWYNKIVTYVPYCFEYDGKRYFLGNLATRTGTEQGDRENRREMASLLTSLRRHHYQYCTFHAIKEDIFEFFKWLRENKYTLEIHGALFTFDPDHGYVDFWGNVREYSAAFQYRIYSREMLRHIIDQLRTVKRYHKWKKEE